MREDDQKSTRDSARREVTLFVGNLAFSAEESDLTAAFEAQGCRVSLVKISRDADGEKSRGYGFVTILTESADAIIESMYGSAICGRNIRVDYSTSARSREDASATTTSEGSSEPGRWGPKTWSR